MTQISDETVRNVLSAWSRLKNAPLPPGNYTINGAVCFWPLLEFAALQQALDHMATAPSAPLTAALGAAPAAEAVTGRKVVQISALASGADNHPCIFAVCDDGSVWCRRIRRKDDVWEQEPTIPAPRPAVAEVAAEVQEP